jgi:hypothetical protein
MNWGERGKTYNGSRIWFHFAICLSTGTSAVFAVVSGLDTVTENILFLIKYFLILGTLMARSTKQKIENVKSSRNLDLIISTDPSPQHVAWIVQGIVLRAIRRFECCSRMVLHEHHYAKEGIDAPLSCALRSRGTWAGIMGHHQTNHRLSSSTHALSFSASR